MIFSVSLLLALPVGASKEPEKDFDNLSLGVILRSRFSWTVCYKSFVDFLKSANSDFHKQTNNFIWPGPDSKYKGIFFSNILYWVFVGCFRGLKLKWVRIHQITATGVYCSSRGYTILNHHIIYFCANMYFLGWR